MSLSISPISLSNAAAWLEFYRLRFTYRAVNPVSFPEGKPGNVLRGGFGTVLRAIAPEEVYSRLFEPLPDSPGPSGFSDRARPFVFRAAHLDDRRLRAGEPFWFDFHLFETTRPALDVLEMTFAQLGREGLGATRGRAELISVHQLDLAGEPRRNGAPLRLPLQPDSREVTRARVEFVTPTELKSHGAAVSEPPFSVLLARARDRVSRLRSLNGSKPLDVDYKGLGERARAVALTRSELKQVEVTRRSSRTGQRHPIGGIVGVAEYEGNLREFMPWLRAAQFTGVGRQTGWGKGEIRVTEVE